MNEAVRLSANNTSSWQLWPLGSQDISYSATGAGTSVPHGSAQPGWMGAAMLVTLATSAGVTGAMAFTSLVGTGGSLDSLISENRTDAISIESWVDLFERIDERTTADTEVVLGGADLIAEIKATLGVSITDLAGIAGVSRQAVYDWIGGGQMSDANYQRLLELRQVCLDWRARAQRPLGHLLRTKSHGDSSLLELLGERPLPRALIALHMDALARMAADQDEQRKARKAKLASLSGKDQYENTLTHAIPATHS